MNQKVAHIYVVIKDKRLASDDRTQYDIIHFRIQY